MSRLLLAALGLLGPGAAAAHGFGAAYTLPVPLGLYHWGAGLTLLLSFLLLCVFWARGFEASPAFSRDLSQDRLARLLRRLLPWLRGLSVFFIILCIATGLFGNRDPLRNFSPIFFWVIFLLLFTYGVALFGDLYAAVNPFRTLTELFMKRRRDWGHGLIPYPQKLGDWPALCLYLGFIWFELFAHKTPRSVAEFLLAYGVLNVIGVLVLGRKSWFTHCEFFAVFFRLVALLAPIDYRRLDAGKTHLRLRAPLSGLIHERPTQLATVVFVLAMLSTTALDGLRGTQWWVMLFWSDPTGIVTRLAGGNPMQLMRDLMPVYRAWETVWLLLSPFVYLAAYMAAVWLAKALTRSPRSLIQLALDFCYSLLPIALVYNMTHYWTLITTQGLKILSLISDPFGWRWDLFGTAMRFRAPILPDLNLVWHSQVGLIIVGHILSVWVAHRVALRIFPTRAQAILSQLPLLALMISLTVFGLWILAQPLTAILPQ